MSTNTKIKFRIFSLVLVQMIVTVVLGILFIFILNKYFDTTNFNLSLNMGGGPGREQNMDEASHQDYKINLKDFESGKLAKGNIELNSNIEKNNDFATFLDNFLSFNRKVLNAQINLQLDDNLAVNNGTEKIIKLQEEPNKETALFYGQVTASGLNLREGPSLDSQIFYVLNKGEVLKVFGKIDKWYMVYSPSKKLTGSVYTEYINPVE